MGLNLQLEDIKLKIEENSDFKCWCNQTNDYLLAYNKLREMYVNNRQICKTIRRQEKGKKRPFPTEALEFEKMVKAQLHKMNESNCNQCKLYKKHMKSIELLKRFQLREQQIQKEIDIQRDIFWNKFISHKNTLERFGYIKDDYPTEKGKTVSQIRSENELFLAEIIFSEVLNELTPAELASVICAVTTEDMRAEMFSGLPLSQKVRKTLNKIKDIRRRIDKVQNDNNIDDEMYINSFYCALIEMWSNGAEWDDIVEQVEMGEGDIVRCFKRVVDVLRQLTTIDNVPESVVFTAREAIDNIQREPIDLD